MFLMSTRVLAPRQHQTQLTEVSWTVNCLKERVLDAILRVLFIDQSLHLCRYAMAVDKPHNCVVLKELVAGGSFRWINLKQHLDQDAHIVREVVWKFRIHA